ncbi:MAG: hypothetical protein ACRDHL_07700 [Candidatus Promineifilaceae bacterium]
MFEVGGNYSNRNGHYIVLEINDGRMLVRYDTGLTAELNMEIQSRIWENIVVEEEARQSRVARVTRRGVGMGAHHYIKPVSVIAAEDLVVPGWQEKATVGTEGKELRSGDRLLYLAAESQVFFAVATITGITEAAAKGGDKADAPNRTYSVDLDAHAPNLESGVALDTVELESQPDIRNLIARLDFFIPINEDEFEIIAELLTEVTEDEEEEEEEEEEEFED